MNLKSAMRRAYRKTDKYALDTLLAEQSKWTRRETIARNKLALVRRKIDALASGLALEKIKTNEP